ncbi:MAG: YbaB/EbfC family nucleoid-associated protein [Micromonosporaceae bacterium]
MTLDRELQARLDGMMAQVRRLATDVTTVQKRMIRVTATVTSEDGLITATVGPRGHLIDLEIDPKIYRRPNSAQLARTIVETVARAVEQSANEVQDLLESTIPEDFSPERIGEAFGVPKGMMRKHDAVILKAQQEEDEDD